MWRPTWICTSRKTIRCKMATSWKSHPKHQQCCHAQNSCSLKLNSFNTDTTTIVHVTKLFMALSVPYLNFSFLQGYWGKTKCASQHWMRIFLICPMASEDLLHEKPVTSLDSSMQPLTISLFLEISGRHLN